MSHTEHTRWCPHCRRSTPHAPLPKLAGDDEMIGQLATSADPQGYFERHYCLQCRAIWRSVELPVEFVESLLAYRPKLEDLKRDVTLLRFLLANERPVPPRLAVELKKRAA